MNDTQRPFGIGFLSIVIIIVGAVQAIGGAVLFFGRNDTDVLDALEVTSSDVTRIAAVTVIMGILGVLVGGALRGGANWARILVGVIALANVVSLVWAATSYHSLHWYDVVWPTVAYGLIAGYLFLDKDAKRYFAS